MGSKGLSNGSPVVFRIEKWIASHHFGYRTFCERTLYLADMELPTLISQVYQVYKYGTVYRIRLAFHHPDTSHSAFLSIEVTPLNCISWQISTWNWWAKSIWKFSFQKSPATLSMKSVCDFKTNNLLHSKHGFQHSFKELSHGGIVSAMDVLGLKIRFLIWWMLHSCFCPCTRERAWIGYYATQSKFKLHNHFGSDRDFVLVMSLLESVVPPIRHLQGKEQSVISQNIYVQRRDVPLSPKMDDPLLTCPSFNGR